ncbi:MAG: ABC transporter ATP-binding protein/permease [Oscillospiraceae bacterium]|nr:ABC transporter ATP-binding protein/permease [Oscillospiraceae bacterium]
MKRLFPFLKPYRLQLTIGPFFKLSEAVLELLIPTLMALLIDNGVNAGNKDYIIKMGIVMLVIATFGVMFAYICQYSASIASQGFGTDVRNAMFKKIETLSFTQLDKFGTPSLINRITGDVNQLQSAVAMLIRLVIRAPFLCVGGLIMAMMIDLKLSIIFMIVIPLFILVLFLVMFKAVPLYKSVQKKLDSLTLVLRENLSGVRVIRAFAGGHREKERFNDKNKDYADTAIRVGKIAALTNPLTSIIMNLAAIAVIYFGGIRVNTGNLSQGEVIAFINYITQILNAMIIVANLVILYTKAYASVLRVSEVLAAEPAIKYGTTAAADKSDNAVEFKNVSLTYGTSKIPAVDDINLTVKKGETLGIIGGTGSGKTTLISLIPRFYDATRGEVLINGVSIADYSEEALRSLVAVVQQRAALFSGTIADNMRMAKADATIEEMREAASVAQATEFIDRLEDGFETYVSQGGNNLSGGQKQRLTIARALVKKSPILILDDSASALDYATDAALRRAIKESTDNQTVIIVSQRVNSVKNADRIAVMDDGEIVGVGTHKELVKNCEIYREICSSQEQLEEGDENEEG